LFFDGGHIRFSLELACRRIIAEIICRETRYHDVGDFRIACLLGKSARKVLWHGAQSPFPSISALPTSFDSSSMGMGGWRLSLSLAKYDATSDKSVIGRSGKLVR